MLRTASLLAVLLTCAPALAQESPSFVLSGGHASDLAAADSPSIGSIAVGAYFPVGRSGHWSTGPELGFHALRDSHTESQGVFVRQEGRGFSLCSAGCGGTRYGNLREDWTRRAVQASWQLRVRGTGGWLRPFGTAGLGLYHTREQHAFTLDTAGEGTLPVQHETRIHTEPWLNLGAGLELYPVPGPLAFTVGVRLHTALGVLMKEGSGFGFATYTFGLSYR